MSGEPYLLDTNAIIALLRGNNRLLKCLKGAEWIGVSILSQIEFLAFPDLSDKDKGFFTKFSQRVDAVGLDKSQYELIDRIIQVRRQYSLKLPDAIIVATAFHYSAALVSEDQQLKNIPSLTTIGLN